MRGSPTRRWSWSKPLGYRDKGKDYDYLILIGEKDNRFPDQYLDTSAYVCFFIPKQDVETLMFKGASIGGIIQITTNFKSVGNQQSKMLLKRMVKLEDIAALIKTPMGGAWGNSLRLRPAACSVPFASFATGM